MSKTNLLASLIAIGMIVSGTLALAAPIPGSQFKAGPWAGSARAHDDNPSLSFCTVQRSFGNGNELSVARSAEGVLVIGIKNAALDLPASEIAAARIAVDGDDLRLQNAVAPSRDTMLIPLPPYAGMIYAARLSNGAVLRIESGANHWQFDLQGMRNAITALGDCLDRNGKMANYAGVDAAADRTGKRVDASPEATR